jgi:hypothetical protein
VASGEKDRRTQKWAASAAIFKKLGRSGVRDILGFLQSSAGIHLALLLLLLLLLLHVCSSFTQ